MMPRRVTARVTLDAGADVAFHRRIYERLRDAILAGELSDGSRLPSSRSLASQLSVARGTVEAAYQRLAGEGYCAGRGPRGTFVEHLAASSPRPSTVTGPRATRRGLDVFVPGQARSGLLMRMGVPALDAFPRKVWSRTTARCARAVGPSDLDYGDSGGQEGLRRAIAGYLRVARGVACAPEQVFITSGFQGALGVACLTLLRPCDRVLVEDPGYGAVRRSLAMMRIGALPVPVDAEGLDVSRAASLDESVRLAVVTPCHQFPTGATLPVARRLALLDWARRTDAWIVEDDYDSEFRYVGRPLPALKSIDRDQRVLYVGTFSKVLCPALRIGYMVVPEGLVERVGAVRAAIGSAPPVLDQTVVAAFMAEGHFARHVRRMRGLYAVRRKALLATLEGELDGIAAVHAPAGGLHLVLRLPRGVDDKGLVADAAAKGLWPDALSPHHVRDAPRPGLLVSFANVAPPDAPRVGAMLAGLISRAVRGAGKASG